MKKLITICAVVTMILVLSGVAQASMVTYYIVDYPAYQSDTKYLPSVYTDHVSGTIIADPVTGVSSVPPHSPSRRGTVGPPTQSSRPQPAIQ